MQIHGLRGFGVAFLLCLLVLALGFIYQQVGRRADLRHHPAAGRLVSVGDHQLHLLCKGSAGPTVVIEQGAGELSSVWWPVQNEIAKFAAVCTYDRAGFGWSDSVHAPRTIEDRARELNTLLSNAGVRAPYIFVAHSYGGLIVRDYFREYPGNVAGLVLVDTPEESSLFRMEVLDFYSKARAMNRVAGIAAQFGVLRLLRHWIPLDRYGFWLTKPAEYSALCDDLASLDRVPAARRASRKSWISARHCHYSRAAISRPLRCAGDKLE
jgi:pimeloyl-ACP methyl ester carboxylesterase